MDQGDCNKKKFSLIFVAIVLLTSTPLKISSIDERDIEYKNTSVDSNYSEIYTELEIAKEIAEQTAYLESIENSKIKASARSLQYTVKLEPITTQTKSTGYIEASNQAVYGTNFVPLGGSFGYKDGNNTRTISLSFGISGFSTSFSIGVGSRQASGVNGYNINATPNKAVKLYVNKQVKVTTYRRYKVYTIKGYKEAYGYVIGTPIVTRLNFNVK